MGKIENIPDIRPKWAIKIEHALVDANMTKRQIASKLGLGYPYIVNILSGCSVQRSNKMRDALCEYFSIDIDDDGDQRQEA
jgi:hypothetical protein